MKNNEVERVTQVGLGPLPSGASDEPSRPTPAQSAVLNVLRRHGRPMTLAELAEETSLHLNTLREHLAVLQDDGLVRKETAEPQGRGRPASLYLAMPKVLDPEVREYAGLASALAAALRRHSPQPAADAVVSGKGWGADLAGTVELDESSSAVERRRAIVALLERLRFAPTSGPQARTIRLTRCPLLDVAHEFPDIVCSIHRGVVEGALEHWGDTTTRVGLEPFAEPGACVLHLSPEEVTRSGRSGPRRGRI